MDSDRSVQPHRALSGPESDESLWAGQIYGTNTGNFFLELLRSGESVSGTIRINDTTGGLAAYRLVGTFTETLAVQGELIGTPGGGESIEAVAALTPQGTLRGRWQTSMGAAGTFVGYPHSIQRDASQTSGGKNLPAQAWTSALGLGALRLYAKDVWSVADSIQKEFTTGRVVVTYNLRGTEVTRFLQDFRQDPDGPGEIRRLKLFAQELDATGIAKSITIDLSSAGQNEVRVTGGDEAWVIGMAESTTRKLRSFEQNIVTTYKKFGLTINNVIFLAMLIIIPSMDSIVQRVLFVAAVMTLLVILHGLHSTLIPNLVVYFGKEDPGYLARIWPTLLSWLIAATASLTAALIFAWLTGAWPGSH